MPSLSDEEWTLIRALRDANMCPIAVLVAVMNDLHRYEEFKKLVDRLDVKPFIQAESE